MRLLQVTVPADRLDAVVAELRDRGIGYAVVETAEEDRDYLVQFVVPADAVEHVLADLTDVGVDRDRFTVSVSTEFASFEGVDDVQEHWANTPNKVAPATLRSKAKDMRLNTRSYVWMMVLSAVVATAGLLMSSPAIVVGSMVIAPIVSPMLAASVGAVRNDRDMVIDSLHQQMLGLGVAIAMATAFAFSVRETQVVPVRLDVAAMELVSLRLSPSMLGVVVGLAAGAAGAFSLATKGRTAILGVMIAAALIPTAGAAGIGIAWGNAVVAVGATLLLLITIVAVNVGGTAMLFYLDYRPDQVDESLFTLETARQAAVVLGTLLLVAVLAVGAAGLFVQQSSFERTVNEVASEVLSEEEYEALGIQSVSIESTAPGRLADEPEVTVTLSRTSDRSYPDLPNRLDRRISEETGREVVVQVRYVDYERSDVSSENASAARTSAANAVVANATAKPPSDALAVVLDPAGGGRDR